MACLLYCDIAYRTVRPNLNVLKLQDLYRSNGGLSVWPVTRCGPRYAADWRFSLSRGSVGTGGDAASATLNPRSAQTQNLR